MICRILVIAMSLFSLTGFAQSQDLDRTEESFKYIATFPNGDEAITIIESSKSNVLKLTMEDNFYKYEILELANHEMAHKPRDMRNEWDIDQLKLADNHDTLNLYTSVITISNQYGEKINIVN